MGESIDAMGSSSINMEQVYEWNPGVDTAVTLQWVAKSVYPELFEEVDIKQMAKDYFSDYFYKLCRKTGKNRALTH